MRPELHSHDAAALLRLPSSSHNPEVAGSNPAPATRGNTPSEIIRGAFSRLLLTELLTNALQRAVPARRRLRPRRPQPSRSQPARTGSGRAEVPGCRGSHVPVALAPLGYLPLGPGPPRAPRSRRRPATRCVMRSPIVARQPKMRGPPRKTSAPPSTNTTCPVTWVFSSLASHASSRATTTASDGPCSGIDSQERRGALVGVRFGRRQSGTTVGGYMLP